jgi:hypothetical protein
MQKKNEKKRNDKEPKEIRHEQYPLAMRPSSQVLWVECISKKGLNEVKQNSKARKG